MSHRYILTWLAAVNLLISAAGQHVTPPGAPDMYSGFNHRVDSLKKELQKFTKQDSFRLKTLIKILDQATFVKERESLLAFYSEAKQIAGKLRDNLRLSNCMYFIANLYKGKKTYDSAVLYADSAIYFVKNIRSQTGQKQYAKSYKLKGQVFYTLENYQDAIPCYLEALTYFDSTRENDKCFLYKDISESYLSNHNNGKYLEYAKKYASAAEENGTPVIIADAYTHLAEALFNAGDMESSRQFYHKADRYFPFAKEYSLNSFYYQQKGVFFRKIGQPDSCLHYLQMALREAEAVDHAERIGNVLQELSITNLQLNRMEQARQYGLRSIQLADSGHNKSGLMNAWYNMSQLYAKQGKFSEAFSSLARSDAFRDSLSIEESIHQINLLEARYQFEKKQKEILVLQKDKETQSAAIRHKSLLNKIFIATMVVLALISVLVYRVFKNKQALLKQKEEIQAQHIRELENEKQLLASKSILIGQEEERSRLAKDLHDGLGGLLSGVKHSILDMKENMILTAENSSAFERSVELIDNSVKELRRIAHNMMPEALAKFGLSDAIRDYCKTINASGSVRITYQNFGETAKYDKSVETSVYRIIQELINNTIKHAGAGAVLVQTVCNPDRISIAVEDDGKGVNPEDLQLSSGAGWRNIRSRVDYLKGSIDVQSGTGKGTSVNIELIVP